MMNIGILGASWIAQKAILEPASEIEQAHVLALGCRDKARGEAYAKEHGIAQVFQDYEEMINSPELDVIYNGLPPAAHAYWTKRALAVGKHVICEKPFAMNAEEAEGMLAAAAASDGRLIEAFHTAYHPSFEACKAWVESGIIGNIVEIDAHFGVPLEDDGKRNQFRPEAGGGSVMDMGCYPLQWADVMIGGTITNIDAKAVMTPSGVDGSMDATLTYDDKTIAKVRCSMVGPGEFSAGMTIKGTEGVIEYNDPLVPQDNGTLVVKRGSGIETSHEVSSKSTYFYQLTAALRAFSLGSPLATEGAPVLRQQKLIDDVYAAAGLSHLRTDFVAK